MNHDTVEEEKIMLDDDICVDFSYISSQVPVSMPKTQLSSMRVIKLSINFG